MKFCLTLSFIQPTDLCEIAQVAEEYGWDAIALADHVVNPDKIEARYPYGETGERMWNHQTPWPDVWVTTAMMAAVTKRMEFVQSVYVLPMRDPFQVAKAVGTLSIMSNHRVHLGVGLGWMHDEFEILGASFARRGARTDEMVEVMRKLWTGELVEHHGEFYDFEPLSMAPGVGREVPILVGGISDHAMRRAARLDAGWYPAYLPLEGLRKGIARIRGLRREAGLREDFDIFTNPNDAVDLDGYRRSEEIGITHATMTPWIAFDGKIDYQKMVAGYPKETILDGIRRFADDVIAKLR